MTNADTFQSIAGIAVAFVALVWHLFVAAYQFAQLPTAHDRATGVPR